MLRRQRGGAPVPRLLGLVERDPGDALSEGLQLEATLGVEVLPAVAHLGGQHRVEQPGPVRHRQPGRRQHLEVEAEVVPHQPGALRPGGEQRRQRPDVDGAGVHQHRPALGGQLHQAQAIGVRVQPRGLGVQPQRRRRQQPRELALEGLLRRGVHDVLVGGAARVPVRGVVLHVRPAQPALFGEIGRRVNHRSVVYQIRS